MNYTERYFSLKRKDDIQYFIIVQKQYLCVVIDGVLGQTASIKVKNFDATKASNNEMETIIKSILEKGYEENENRYNLSALAIALETIETEDVAKFEDGLYIIKALIDIYYNRDKKHPFVKFMGVIMESEELVTTPILDEYLQKHINKLSSNSLVYILQMTLQNIHFNFAATSIAVEEIVNRKDLEAQLAVVNQFYKACKYYDSGHRSMVDTNHDILIDTYFPKFESEALYKLLEKAPGDMLNRDGGDEMDALFAPALHGTTDENFQQKILDVFEAYKKEYEENEYLNEAYFDAIMEDIEMSASAYVIQGIENIRLAKKKREALVNAIEAFDTIKIEKLIEGGAKLDNQLIEKVIEQTLEKGNLSIIKLFKVKNIKFDVEELFSDPDNHVDILAEVIESDIIDINYLDEDSNENLLFFVSGNKVLLEALLKKGINVNHKATEGSTVLGKVCSYSKADNPDAVEIIKLLLSYNANPNADLVVSGRENGMAPLHFAVKNEAVEITRLLIGASVDVNAMPDNGVNPLMIAHSVGNNKLIELLENAGATAPEKEILKINFIRIASKQQWDRLLDLEEEIISKWPNEFLIYLSLARAYYFSRANYSKAVNYAERAILLEVNNLSLDILFMSLIRLGQLQKAIDIFKKYKKSFNPRRLGANNIIANLIVAYCASSQIQEGIKVLSSYFNEVEESRKEKGVMNFNIACIYALANDTYEMLPYIIKALERGYTKDDFLNESDFSAYRKDALFLFIINQDHKNTIELEKYAKDKESNTFKRLKVIAYYNTETFLFDDECHKFSCETGTIGEEERTVDRLFVSKALALTVYFYKAQKINTDYRDQYFILKEKVPQWKEKINIEFPRYIMSKFDFLSGSKISFSEDLPINLTTNAKRGDTIPDFIEGKIPLVSKKLLDLIKAAGVDNIQVFPVSIKSIWDSNIWSDFFAINLLEIIDCGLFPKSLFKETELSIMSIRPEIAINIDKTKGALFFRLEKYRPLIVFHRSVGKYIVENDPDKELIWDIGDVIQ